jgi:hypothetical protein
LLGKKGNGEHLVNKEQQINAGIDFDFTMFNVHTQKNSGKIEKKLL